MKECDFTPNTEWYDDPRAVHTEKPGGETESDDGDNQTEPGDASTVSPVPPPCE